MKEIEVDVNQSPVYVAKEEIFPYGKWFTQFF